MLYLQPMKTLLLVLLFSLSSISFAEDYYPLDAPENTALFVAIATGDFEKAEKLLKTGVNPNKKSVKGATVFTALAITNDEQGSIDFLPTLIKYGADINNQDDDGNTGLIVAVIKHRYRLAQAFVQNEEIDINTQNKAGHATIHYALSSGYEDIDFLKVLLSHPEININLESPVPILIPLMFLADGLYYALHPKTGSVPDYEKIEKASQVVKVLLSSSHDFDLTIKNQKEVSPYDLLLALKEHLPKLPKDSDLYPAFNPIREVLSSNKYIGYNQ